MRGRNAAIPGLTDAGYTRIHKTREWGKIPADLRASSRPSRLPCLGFSFVPLPVHSWFQLPAPPRSWLAALALITAGVLAWANSFSGPFVFDDRPAILANPSLEHVTTALAPPHDGGTTAGRPLVNVSLWLNRTLGGTEVRGYHAFNLALHLCAALTLFGLVRRTLAGVGRERSQDPSPTGSPSQGAGRGHNAIAFSAALLWTVHPLQTASVTYIVQRAEAMAALCVLLTLYAFIRAIGEAPRPLAVNPGGASLRPAVSPQGVPASRRGASTLWLALSVLACLAGMACKEVAAVTPLLVLLYCGLVVEGDIQGLRPRNRWAGPGSRTAASKAQGVRFSVLWMWAGCPHPASASRDPSSRGEGTPPSTDTPPPVSAPQVPAWYFLALAATWIPLAWLVWQNGFRSGTAGFSSGVTPFSYALTQCVALVHYLRLAFWPAGLVFDYGTATVERFTSVVPQVLVVALLLAATLVLLRRKPAIGFLGAAFFLILAPSSSFLPIATETIAEHRMYLPLAVLTIGAALLLHRVLHQRAWLAALAIAVPLIVGVQARNRDYASAVALWSDTVAKRPDNPRAQGQLGNALTLAGRAAEALPHFEAAVQLDPRNASAHANLATALFSAGRAAEAIPHYRTALQLDPGLPMAEANLAQALAREGQPADALSHYAAAEKSGTLDASGHYNYGVALVRMRRFSEAVPQFQATLREDPAHVGALVNLGNALLLTRRASEAVAAYESALRLQPDDPQISRNLARARALSP